MANLFYIMGASGSGKDSVINLLKQQQLKDTLFASRYITRPADAGGENHIELSQSEFEFRCKKQLFSMHWQANNLSYGIGCEIDLWLAKDINVVINGSREYLPQAQALHGERLRPVVINVALHILEQRLRQRQREDEKTIQKRLVRASAYHDQSNLNNSIYLDNSGSLTATVKQFLVKVAGN